MYPRGSYEEQKAVDLIVAFGKVAQLSDAALARLWNSVDWDSPNDLSKLVRLLMTSGVDRMKDLGVELERALKGLGDGEPNKMKRKRIRRGRGVPVTKKSPHVLHDEDVSESPDTDESPEFSCDATSYISGLATQRALAVRKGQMPTQPFSALSLGEGALHTSRSGPCFSES